MTDLWVSLLPIAAAMIVVPGRFIAMILLFHTQRAVLTPLSYVAGMASTMFVQGLLFAAIFSFTGVFSGSDVDGPPLILATLFLVIGVLMVVGGLRMWFQPEDEDHPPPSWLDEIESFAPRKAFTLGLSWLFISPKQWVFDLVAVAVIFAADLDPIVSLANYLLLILVVLSPFLLLVLITIMVPARSAAVLDALFDWLKLRARAVMIAVLLCFGAYFLLKGISGLMA